MADFGENLRREREMRGVTLQEISDTTKISIRLLEALENEEFSKLPGGIFARSFIRAYANYLGLDQEQVIAEFELAAPPRGEEDFSRIGVSSSNGKKRSRLPILPWLIAVVLLGGGYTLFRYAHRATEEPVSLENSASGPAAAASVPAPAPNASEAKNVGAPAGAPDSASPSTAGPAVGALGATTSADSASDGSSLPGSAAPVTSEPSSAAAASGASIKTVSTRAPVLGVMSSSTLAASASAPGGSNGPSADPGNTAPVTPAPGELVLQIAATQRSWVAVKADGKTVLERILNPHEIRTLTAKQFFDVTTGNALGTVLTLDGVTLKPLGRSGEVKSVHLTPDTLKTATP